MPTDRFQTDRNPGWAASQRHLHWWTAALVLIGFSIGWLMVNLPLSQLLAKFLLYQVHKSIGILVFALVCVRLLLRVRRKRPDPDPSLPAWQRRAADGMHALLYLLLLLIPVLGYLTAATAPANVPTLFLGVIAVPHLLSPDREWFAILRQIHRGFAVALVLLACGHAAAAIHNHRLGRATLARMWRGHAAP